MTRPRSPGRRAAVAAALAAWPLLSLRPGPAAAQPATAPVPAPAPAPHPWLSVPLRAAQPETYFTNLEDGARIETPFLLKFGLSRYGLSPITKPVARTGHHHLMVNRELPLDFTKPLPFDDQYLHFGKGQMETVLTFPPGTYTLRLLLADDKHIPHFIYSKPLRIEVTARRDDIDPKSLVKPGITLLAPRSGETLRPPFRVVFHASGLNVGHTEVQDAGVGHFQLMIDTPSGDIQRIAFENGATEAWLAPPPGYYRMRLQYVSNADRTVAHRAEPVDISVTPR